METILIIKITAIVIVIVIVIVSSIINRQSSINRHRHRHRGRRQWRCQFKLFNKPLRVSSCMVLDHCSTVYIELSSVAASHEGFLAKAL